MCALATALCVSPVRAGVTASSVLPASPTAQGYPQFQFSASTGDTSFTIGRGVPGDIGSCPGSGETLDYDTAHDFSWCDRTVSAGSNASYSLVFQNNVWFYTDKSIQLDDVDIREFKYRAKKSSGTSSAFVSAWTASCPIPGGVDPLVGWLAAFNQQSGSSTPLLTRADIPDPPASDPRRAEFKTYRKTYTDKNNVATTIDVHVLANDKYVAVFGPLGTLAGLTHRALGAEFINFSGPQTPIWNAGWRILAGPAGTSTPATLVPGNNAYDNVDTHLPKISASFQQNFYYGSSLLTFTWGDFPTSTGFAGVTVSNMWLLNDFDDPDNLNSGLSGYFAVEGNPASHGYLEVQFPILTGLGSRQTVGQTTQQVSDLLWPISNNAGTLVTNYNANVRQQHGTLFSELQMPFFGVLSGGSALYVAATDPEHNPKYFYFQNYWKDTECVETGNCTGATFISHYPTDGTGVVGNTLEPLYGVQLKPMCGGHWERVAKQYRSWATRQSWTQKDSAPAKLIDRGELPASVRKGLFWWTVDNGPGTFQYGTPGRTLNYVNQLKSVIGPHTTEDKVPLGIHLYQWYTLAMDHNTPVFIEKAAGADPYDLSPNPPVVSIPDVIADVQADSVAGDHSMVMPYLNVENIDFANRTIPDYTNRNCPPQKGRGFYNQTLNYGGYNGPVNGSTFDFGIKLAGPTSVAGVAGSEDYFVMCLGSSTNPGGVQLYVDPSLPQWQGIVDFNINKVFDLGAGGVYMDVFGSGYAPDYNVAHGHDGHGAWWRDGQATMAANAAAAAASAESNPSTAVFNTSGVRRVTSAEFFAEPFMQSVDLVMNYTTATPVSVPLLNSVYSGYQMVVGGANHGGSTNAVRSAVFGRSFVWGNQLLAYGTERLCGSTSMCSGADPMVIYVRKLASARHTPFLINYLSYGELMQVADDVNAANTLDYKNSDRWCDDIECSQILPLVRGMRWKSGSNSANEVIVLTNTDLSNSVSNVQIPLPATWSNGVSLCDYDNTSCAPATVSGNKIALWMDAGAIKVLKKN